MKSVIDELVDYSLSKSKGQKIAKAILGAHYSYVELNDGGAGTAITNREGGISPGLPGTLTGMRIEDAISYLNSGRGLDVTFALASMNALLNRADEEGVERGDALEASGIKPDDYIVFVGYFNSYIRRLKGSVRGIAVLELIEIASRDAEVYPWWAYSMVFKRATKLYITGTSIVNHTINYILPASADISFKVVLGPSTPLAKDVFTRYGVNLVSFSTIKDKRLCEAIIREGGGAREMFDRGCLDKLIYRQV